MITIKQKGNFKKTNRFLERALNVIHLGTLDKYGREGVAALSAATPNDSGITAESWSYEIERSDGKVSIIWSNSHVVNGVNIAVILQYGHATRNGSWVEGIDYINPALQPLFNKIAESAWKEVTKK